MGREYYSFPLFFKAMTSADTHIAFTQYFEKGIQILKAAREYFGKENVDSSIIPIYYKFKEKYRTSILNTEQVLEAIENIDTHNSMFLILYFPKITVINEREESTIVYDTYVRVPVDFKHGRIRGKFCLLRTKYTKAQLINKYCHSHVPSLNLHRLENWLEPCLGSGPINTTITRLARDFDIDVWGLFFFELKKYLRTESLEGIPYKKLSQSKQIASKTFDVRSLFTNTSDNYTPLPQIFRKFIKHFILTNNLKFTFCNSITLAETPEELWVKLSNSFLKWAIQYKSLNDLIAQGFIMKGIYKDYKLIALDNINIEIACNREVPIINFKGDNKYLSIVKQEDASENPANLNYMLNPKLIVLFIKRVLNIVNVRYITYLNHDYCKYNKYRSV